MLSPEALSIPIFWGQGKEDEIIYPALVERSLKFMKAELGLPEAARDAPENGGLLFNAYEGLEHAAGPQELRELVEWLRRVVPHR